MLRSKESFLYYECSRVFPLIDHSVRSDRIISEQNSAKKLPLHHTTDMDFVSDYF